MKGRSWFLYSLLISLFFLLLFPIHYEARSVKDCMEEDVDCLKQWHGDAEQIDEKNQEDKKTSLDRLKKDSMFFNVLKVFFALLFILLLIYLAIRFLNNRHLSTAQRKVMENLGGISLGQNKSVQVIRVGEKVYLLGVGENVELLKEISDQNLIDELIHKNDQNFDTKSFLDFFKTFEKEKDQSQSDPQKKSFSTLFANELEKMQKTREELKATSLSKEDANE